MLDLLDCVGDTGDMHLHANHTVSFFIGESVHAVLTALNITAENVPQQNKIDKQKDIHLKVESDIR